MLVTELGISILVRPVQPQKAQLPILVTELGIIEFLHPNKSVCFVISNMQLSTEQYEGLLEWTVKLSIEEQTDFQFPEELDNVLFRQMIRSVLADRLLKENKKLKKRSVNISKEGEKPTN